MPSLIDPSDAELRPLSEYCDRLPSRVCSRKLNRATLWRWALRGARGRVLRTVVIGSGRFTCDAWVAEFFDGCAPREPWRPRPMFDPARLPSHAGLDAAERERIARKLGVRPRTEQATR